MATFCRRLWLVLADVELALATADFLRDSSEIHPPTGGSSISAVHSERTAHPVPPGGVSADQSGIVVRGGVEPPTFRFSGQPRQALCRPAKTDVTDKRNRARRKVQEPR
jgi:hypothetical protein